MNRMFIAAALVLLSFSCKKSKDAAVPVSNEVFARPHTLDTRSVLEGKWLLKNDFVSPGAGYIYQENSDKSKVVEFKSDGTIASAITNFPFDRYEVQSDEKVLLKNSSTNAERNSYYHIENDELVLSWQNCIEGCGSTFIPIK